MGICDACHCHRFGKQRLIMSQGINFVKSYLFALSLRKGSFVVFGGMDEWLYQQEIRFEDRSAISIHRMLYNRGICCVSFLVNFGSIFIPCITFLWLRNLCGKRLEGKGGNLRLNNGTDR